MRGHTDRAEAEMAVHVAALTKPVGELIEAVPRKHHRAVLEAVKELHERCTKAERERDAARDSLRQCRDWIADRRYGEEWPDEDLFYGSQRHLIRISDAILEAKP